MAERAEVSTQLWQSLTITWRGMEGEDKRANLKTEKKRMRKRERNKMRWEIDMEIGVESKVPATSTFATWNVLQRNKTVAVAVPSRGGGIDLVIVGEGQPRVDPVTEGCRDGKARDRNENK